MSQITTHVLDTTRGLPAEGIPVSLAEWSGCDWIEIASGVTNQDGRISDLLSKDTSLAEGRYKVSFELEGYFSAQQQPLFYPRVDIECCIAEGGAHYHIPLLLSPFGYSTYRGS